MGKSPKPFQPLRDEKASQESYRQVVVRFEIFHQSLRVTPAMEASVSGHVWGLEELLSLL